MRHRKSGRKLGRTASHRKALLSNLANQLLEKKEITTTTAKAKEARSSVDRLITYAKKGGPHHRRLAFGFLRNKETTKILFEEIAPAYTERPGGYTRVLKLGRRQGDGASLSLLQLVGFEKLAEVSKPEKKRSRKKSAASKEKPVATEETVKAETPVDEIPVDEPEGETPAEEEEKSPEEPKE
jgi:large subunit ribosomal protein L17